MEILYKNKRVEKEFSSQYKKSWKYPSTVERKLIAAENFIQSAVSLNDVIHYPPFHFHRLEGKRKAEWSIYLGNTGYRVAMIPCDDEGNEIVDGDIIAQCKQIKIVEITEVSNHYE